MGNYFDFWKFEDAIWDFKGITRNISQGCKVITYTIISNSEDVTIMKHDFHLMMQTYIRINI